MASTAWINFRGIRPLSTPEHDVSGTAVVAHNVDLRGHKLETWRTPRVVADTIVGAKVLMRAGMCWLASAKAVTYALRGPECGISAIMCGDGRPRLITVAADCSVSMVNLAIPTPEATPVVSVEVNGYSEGSDPRAYAYAYTRNGEHGALSRASSELVVLDDVAVTISNLVPPPIGHGIDGIVIYRRMPGFITGREQVAEHVTRWIALRTIPEAGGLFVDNARGQDVAGEGLDMPVVYPPPDKLKGVITFQNVPGHVGYYDTYVAFSEGRLAHSWPMRYRCNLGVAIRSVQEVDGMVYVVTEASPFVFNISNGVEKGTVPRELSDWKLGMLPGDRKITKWNGAVVYVSKDGLVRLTSRGPELMTDKWFTPAQWRRLDPQNMVLGASREFLFLVAAGVTYLWQFDPADQAHLELTTTEWKPDTFTMHNDELYGVVAGKIEQWNAGALKYVGRWRSADVRIPVGVAFSSVEVKADNSTNFSLYADGVRVDQMVVGQRPVRIARYGRSAMRHAVELEGAHLSVGAVYLASAHRDHAGASRG